MYLGGLRELGTTEASLVRFRGLREHGTTGAPADLVRELPLGPAVLRHGPPPLWDHGRPRGFGPGPFFVLNGQG